MIAFIGTLLSPGIVPETQQVFNKYLLNECNAPFSALVQVPGSSSEALVRQGLFAVAGLTAGDSAR